jgi:RimJ/RimL family protein N-acetyltransferase
MPEIPLLGGGSVFLRPLTRADGPALAAGSAELSPRSAHLRFHAPRPGRLSEAEIAFLTDVDQHDHAAWAVLDGSKGIAVGRYYRLETLPDTAEVALAILDPWQGRGLAKLLLAALMRTARRAGIARLGAAIMGENTAAQRLLASLGAEPRHLAGDIYWAEVETDPDLLPQTPAAEAVRHYQRLLAEAGAA